MPSLIAAATASAGAIELARDMLCNKAILEIQEGDREVRKRAWSQTKAGPLASEISRGALAACLLINRRQRMRGYTKTASMYWWR